jgi:hypothetical protein
MINRLYLFVYNGVWEFMVCGLIDAGGRFQGSTQRFISLRISNLTIRTYPPRPAGLKFTI